MRFGKQWLDEVITVNPIVVFTHKDWPDSSRALELFREAGVDDIHEVRVDGHAGEVPILHSLAKRLDTGEENLQTCRIFIGGECLGDASGVPEERALAEIAKRAGAKVHEPPPRGTKSRSHSADRLFVPNKKGLA